MHTKIALILLTLLLLQSCGKKDEEAQPVQQSLTGNSSLNKFILTSKEEEVIRVDPATGAHEKLFSFEKYADVSDIDYLNGIMYVTAEDNSINAIDLQSKKLLWDLPLIDYELTTISSQTTTVKDNVCYAVGEAGVMLAIDIVSGKPIWAYNLNPSGSTDSYYPTSAITVTANKVFIGSNQTVLYEDERNYVFALDRATGKLIWRKELPKGKWVSGAIKLAGNTLLVPANNLMALDVATGNLIWEFKMPELDRGAGSPSIAGDRVLVHGSMNAALGGRLFCLNLSNGQKIWDIEGGGEVVGGYAPLVVDKVVFGVYERGSSLQRFGNGRPYLADIATGKKIWENDDISVETSPVYANGRLFFHGQHFAGEGSIDDNVGLLCLDAATGKFLWINNYFRFGAAVTPIVVADNGIFRPGSYQE